MHLKEKVLVKRPHEADFDKDERDLLLDGLRRNHRERFLHLMTLVKMQATFQKMQIRHKKA